MLNHPEAKSLKLIGYENFNICVHILALPSQSEISQGPTSDYFNN